MKKVAKEYFCESCNYKCYNKTNYEKHLTTQKHIKRIMEINGNIEVEKVIENFICEKCEKVFKTNSGLWKHKNKNLCKEVSQNKSIISEELVLDIININKEQRDQIYELTNTIMVQSKQMTEIIPKIGNNNNNNNTINNNQRFNINVFLNEECKNAINMSDFIKSIEVSLEQLDLTKTKGLEKGITKVIMDNMNKLSVYERPLHCTDVKRETLYIKDNDKWEKDKDKTKIKQIINKTQDKNFPALINWKKANPDYMEHDDKQIYYAKTMSAVGKRLDGIDDKIIKNICKETYIKE